MDELILSLGAGSDMDICCTGMSGARPKKACYGAVSKPHLERHCCSVFQFFMVQFFFFVCVDAFDFLQGLCLSQIKSLT